MFTDYQIYNYFDYFCKDHLSKTAPLEHLLCGTSLRIQVQNALSLSEQPLSVRQVAEFLTKDTPEQNTRNLHFRVRRSLNWLQERGYVERSGIGATRNLSYNTFTITEMGNIKERLKSAMSGMNAASAQGMLSMVKPMLPGLEAKFVTHLQQMAQPKAEGTHGILQEGESHAGFWITQKDGKLVIAECALTYDPNLKKMVMSKPVATRKLEDILSMQS